MQRRGAFISRANAVRYLGEIVRCDELSDKSGLHSTSLRRKRVGNNLSTILRILASMGTRPDTPVRALRRRRDGPSNDLARFSGRAR